MPRLNNKVCVGCACVCDDITVEIEDDQVQFENACSLGDAWVSQPTPSVDVRVDGEQAELEFAIESAATLLANARNPLIAGMGSLTTEGQQQLVNLAIGHRATIDTTFSHGGRSGVYALQRQGAVTATLGEVNQRGDTIVFWFCDPLTTHPRFVERYCQTAKTIIVVDAKSTPTSKKADLFIQATHAEAIRNLTQIRSIIAGKTSSRTNTSLDSEQAMAFKSLSTHLENSQYAVSIYGAAASDSQFDLIADSIVALTRELTSRTRAVCVSMRMDANTLSAENVLTWTTGAPFSMKLPVTPESFDASNRAATLLELNQCDLVFVAGGFDLPHGNARTSLANSNSIWLVADRQTEQQALELDGNVIIAVGRPGITDSGSWCRMDDVSLPLSKLTTTSYPSALEVIRAIKAHKS